MKNIPLIIINFNQLTYLKNLINQWKFYNPDNPVYVLDNNSNYQPLLDYYELNPDNVNIVRHEINHAVGNLKAFLEVNHFDYYVVSDADISICPNTPPNFLAIFKHCIEQYGYNHVGFCLKIDDLPPHVQTKKEIIFNEQGFWSTPVSIEFEGNKYLGYKAPIDTTFAMYKGGEEGWEKPMPAHKWSNSLRILDAYHLTWYLHPNIPNAEMDNYFDTASYRVPGISSTGVNNYRPKKVFVKNTTYADMALPHLLEGAIENNEFEGFKEDYHVLHCLLKLHKPKSIFEIGTNMGRGTKIMKNAVPEAGVYSLDLPTELAHISLQHPINEGHGDSVGHLCDLPFIQLRGDSMKFDYSQHKCECAFIDGEHDFDHPKHETQAMMDNGTKLIIWHDADIPDVWRAIITTINDDYELYRVLDTRIAFAVRK
jgi:hypothetical protein